MKVPVMSGLIDRRILVNFRVDANVLATVLPAPFRPKLVDGKGIAGVCLIRLAHITARKGNFQTCPQSFTGLMVTLHPWLVVKEE